MNYEWSVYIHPHAKLSLNGTTFIEKLSLIVFSLLFMCVSILLFLII